MLPQDVFSFMVKLFQASSVVRRLVRRGGEEIKYKHFKVKINLSQSYNSTQSSRGNCSVAVMHANCTKKNISNIDYSSAVDIYFIIYYNIILIFIILYH